MNTTEDLFSEEHAIAIIELHKEEILQKVRCSSAEANQSQADGTTIDPGWPDSCSPDSACLNCTCCV